MKELYEFATWASKIIESPLLEKTDRAIRREIPVSHDIQYQAQRKYPDRSPEQALSLYLADKLEDIERINYDQNTVINAQRRENAKLNNNLSQLQKEIKNIEDSSADTDAEITRLKSLSGQLKSEINTRKVDSAEISQLLGQVEALKNKPGMSPQLYAELKDKIEAAENKNVNAEELKKISNTVTKLRDQQEIEKEDIVALKNSAAAMVLQRDDIAAEREELSDVLRSIKAEKNSLNQIIGDVRTEKEAALQAKKDAQDAIDMLNDPKKMVRHMEPFQDYAKAVQKRSKQANTLIKNFLKTDFPDILNSIKELNISDAHQDEQIKSIANKTGVTISSSAGRRPEISEPIPDTVAARAALASPNDDISALEPSKEPEEYELDPVVSKYSQGFNNTQNNIEYAEDEPSINSKKYSKKIKEDTNRPSIVTPQQRLFLLTLNKMIIASEPVQLERLLFIMKNYPEEIVLMPLLKEGHNIFKKWGELIIGPGHLGIIIDHIIWTIEKKGYPPVKFRSSRDPILFSALKKYKKWVNETDKVIADVEKLYQEEKAKYLAYAEREKVPGHMLGLDDDFTDTKFDELRLEESIENMVNNIIGEQVARWIK